MLYITKNHSIDIVFFNHEKDDIKTILDKFNIDLSEFKFGIEEYVQYDYNTYLYKCENIDFEDLVCKPSKLIYQIDHYLDITGDEVYDSKKYTNEILFATSKEDVISVILYVPHIEDYVELNVFYV